MNLRYAGTCSVCRVAVGRGAPAWWDAEAKVVRCLPCHERRGSDGLPPPVADGPVRGGVWVEGGSAATPVEYGVAGRSAQEEYERRHGKEQERLEQRWGRLAGVAKVLHEDAQSTTAWAKGASGELRVANFLDEVVGGHGVVLNDRRVPGTRGNIDHLAVVPSGVWIIDAKNYTGKVEQKDIGGWIKTDLRLYVGGRDRSKAADGLGWQVLAVAQAVLDTSIPIHPALFFVGCDWGLFAKPFRQGGVLVGPPKKLAEIINAPGPLDGPTIQRVALTLAQTLPAK